MSPFTHVIQVPLKTYQLLPMAIIYNNHDSHAMLIKMPCNAYFGKLGATADILACVWPYTNLLSLLVLTGP
eukprot:6193983-Pleurochrysis_carterae.AAC.2